MPEKVRFTDGNNHERAWKRSTRGLAVEKGYISIDRTYLVRAAKLWSSGISIGMEFEADSGSVK